MARAVPYAADLAGHLVGPDEAFSGAAYRCLQCKEAVSFRREHLGRNHKVDAHFAHRPGSQCAGESVIHMAAKMRLCEALTLREQPFTLEDVRILKGVVSKDHVHMHMEYPPMISISDLVKRLKGRTSRMCQGRHRIGSPPILVIAPQAHPERY